MASKNDDVRYVDLTALSTAFRKHFWVGTKEQLDTALAAGEIADNTFVKVTDDYEPASGGGSGVDTIGSTWPVSIDNETTGLTAVPYGWYISTTIKNACLNTLKQNEKSPFVVPFMIIASGKQICLKGSFIISVSTSGSAVLTANVEWEADGWTLSTSSTAIGPLKNGVGQNSTTLFIGNPIANSYSEGINWMN